MKISAKIVADSVSNGIRITTLELHAPKILDAQLEKHRMLSSNSSSDRAIPLEKLLSKGYNLPQDIRLDEPGMQGQLSLDEKKVKAFHQDLLGLFDNTTNILRKWKVVHKQHLNRYLLGFSWQHKVVTATQWDNFFKLRLHKDAQPEMRELARCMKEAMDASTPTRLKAGEWHLPYVEKDRLWDIETAIKCSVARCARVSYLNHDNSTSNIDKDIVLADKLLEAGHKSPFEHQATPMRDATSGQHYAVSNWQLGVTHMDRNFNLWSGNFKSWIQNRQLLSTE